MVYLIAALLTVLVIATVIVVAVSLVNTKNAKIMANFAKIIGDLPLQTQLIYRIPYASGVVMNHLVIVSLLPRQLNDAGMSMVTADAVRLNYDVLVRIRIPGSAHSALYTAVLSEHPQTLQRTITGWENPETHFFVHHAPSDTMQDSLTAFAQLSDPTKQALVQLADAYLSVSVVPADMLVTLIGANHVASLLRAQPTSSEEAELVVRLPNDQSLAPHIDQLLDVVERLANDLQ